MIVLNLYYTMKSGKTQEFLDKIYSLNIPQDTLNEEGCEDYSFYAAYDKDKILLVEKWLNEESLENHKNQEHFKKLIAIKEDFVIETAAERY